MRCFYQGRTALCQHFSLEGHISISDGEPENRYELWSVLSYQPPLTEGVGDYVGSSAAFNEYLLPFAAHLACITHPDAFVNLAFILL